MNESDEDFKLTYVKRWRTIVKLPAKYADEIVEALRSGGVAQGAWHPIETAPKDGREILVRRHNDVCHEHYVVWWTGNQPYPWAAEHTAYPEHRLDEWCEIPREASSVTSTDRDPADVWEDYCAEVPNAADRSPQGAMAFALSGTDRGTP